MVTVEKNSAQGKAAASPADAGYIIVPLGLAILEPKFEFDLYTHQEGQYVLYVTAGSLLEKESLQALRASGTTALYARCSNPAPLQYYEANLSRILRESRLEIGAKSRIFVSVASHLVQNVLEDPQSPTAVKRSKDLATHLVDLILKQEDSFFTLARLTSPSYLTSTHSVNTCTLAVGLGRRMGITLEADFVKLGLGALLHDIGQRVIDPGILNKTTPLTERDWKVVRKHPEWGVKLITQPHMLPPGALRLLEQSSPHGVHFHIAELPIEVQQVIEQHHEACNGRGYPYGLTGREIHLFSKIVKIADIYDSMTTNRCYKKANTPFQAAKLIQEAFADEIDQSIFKEFILLLGSGTRH